MEFAQRLIRPLPALWAFSLAERINMENEFLCFFCKEPASMIAYYSKLYQESGRSTIENPTLICDKCFENKEVRGQLHAHRGGWEGVHSISFKKIAEMPENAIGIFLSKSGKEVNHLNNKPWRKLFFRIHFRCSSLKGKNVSI